jgi:pyruvate formate lyase activating enzyme
MKICGVQGVSVIDYPGKIASIFFLGGCNFSCPFCHNVSLIEGYKQLDVISSETVLDDLKKRKGFIDAVVITGGEPLINGSELIALLSKLRQMDLSIKLDTNGYNTYMLRNLLELGLVDYVAMDIKTSIDRYAVAAGLELNTDKILNSIEIIRESSVEYEFRTTCVPGLVDSREIESIACLIEGAARYYLQQYRVEQPTLDPSYMKLPPYPAEKLESFKVIAQKYVNYVSIRGL